MHSNRAVDDIRHALDRAELCLYRLAESKEKLANAPNEILAGLRATLAIEKAKLQSILIGKKNHD